MAQVPLSAAAGRALRAVRRLRLPIALPVVRPTEAGTPKGQDEYALRSEPQITDEANWLDLNREEQVAFDEKLSAFLDLDVDVENKERDWLMPNN